MDFEECAHKLCKIKLNPGQEAIVCKMILECCMQERTFLKFYGLLGERFCRISAAFQDGFDDLFAIQVRFESDIFATRIFSFAMMILVL